MKSKKTRSKKQERINKQSKKELREEIENSLLEQVISLGIE